MKNEFRDLQDKQIELILEHFSKAFYIETGKIKPISKDVNKRIENLVNHPTDGKEFSIYLLGELKNLIFQNSYQRSTNKHFTGKLKKENRIDNVKQILEK